MKQRHLIGETVEMAGFPKSQIIGLDRYTLFSLSGKTKNWISYTLSYEENGKAVRWWMSDEPSGLYLWNPVGPDEVKGDLDLDESGLCVLQIEGDSTISSPYSAVTFFKDGEYFYCLEAFHADGQVFSMRATRIGQTSA